LVTSSLVTSAAVVSSVGGAPAPRIVCETQWRASVTRLRPEETLGIHFRVTKFALPRRASR
jgi:hypothetical protein